MDIKELNLYEVNEFNKKIKEQLDYLKNEDNNKVSEYATSKLAEQKEELKGLKLKEIENDGNLTAQEWLKKSFLEQEISKNQDTISNIEEKNENAKAKLLELRLEREKMLRALELKRAKTEIKIADMQDKWNDAAQKLNENMQKMRSIDKESDEYKELEAENKKHKTAMKRNVLTSTNGMKLQKELDDIKSMINILKSEAILEGIKKPEVAPKKNVKKIKLESEKEETKTEVKVEDSEKKEETKTEAKVEDSEKREETKTEAKVEDSEKKEETKTEAKVEDSEKIEETKTEAKVEDSETTKKNKRAEKIIKTVKINPLKNSIELLNPEGEILLTKELNYEHETIEKTIEELKENYYIDHIEESIDPNIVNILKDVPGGLEVYFNTILGKDSPINIHYNLKDIYSSDLKFAQIKEINKIAKAAQKKSNGLITQEKDSLLKRAFGYIRKSFETSTLLAAVNAVKNYEQPEETEKDENKEEIEKEEQEKNTEEKVSNKKRTNIISKSRSIVESLGRETIGGLKTAGTKILGHLKNEDKVETEETKGFVQKVEVDHEKANRAVREKNADKDELVEDIIKKGAPYVPLDVAIGLSKEDDGQSR